MKLHDTKVWPEDGGMLIDLVIDGHILYLTLLDAFVLYKQLGIVLGDQDEGVKNEMRMEGGLPP